DPLQHRRQLCRPDPPPDPRPGRRTSGGGAGRSSARRAVDDRGGGATAGNNVTALGDILHLLITANLWQATLAAAVLLLLPALGGVISERSGVVNIAMEGMMLTGAFFGVVADLAWHNPWLATLVEIAAGGAMALIHAVVSIRFRADQIVSGIAINIFAAGLTVFLINRIFGLQDVGHVGQSELLPYINVPVLDQIPFLGRVLFQQNVVVYAAIVLLVVVQLMLFRTRLGLRIRSVGEHPQAADTA